MEIRKQDYKSVQRVVRQRLARVTLNQTWLRIHTEFAIGSRDGRDLILTLDDRERLRSTLRQTTGLDPLHDEPDADRLDMSRHGSNEKLAARPVFAGELKLFRLQRPIPLVGGSAGTPPGSYLSTRPDQLDLSGLDALVLIENGAALLHWSSLCADPGIRHALALYRGHDESARQVLNLLDRLRGQVRIYAAVDFDPAGFRIALSLGADALLVPEHYPRILHETHLNKTEAFDKQNTRAEDANIPPGWKAPWDWIHQHRIAVTQEALLARNWHMLALPARDPTHDTTRIE